MARKGNGPSLVVYCAFGTRLSNTFTRSWMPAGLFGRAHALSLFGQPVKLRVEYSYQAGFENREEILSVPGIDGCLVGTGDLAMSMGHAGALVHGAHGTFAAKKTALEAAGARVFGSLDEMTRGIVAALRR